MSSSTVSRVRRQWPLSPWLFAAPGLLIIGPLLL